MAATVQVDNPETIRSQLMKDLKFIKEKCEKSLERDGENKSHVKSAAYMDIIKISSKLVEIIEEFLPILNSPDIFSRFLKEEGFPGRHESTAVEDLGNLIRDYSKELKVIPHEERGYLGLNDLGLLNKEIESISVNVRNLNSLIERIVRESEKKFFR